MKTIGDVKKWLIETEKPYRIGMRLLYVVAFIIYGYFMYLDSLFADSWQPFLIGSLAYLLIVPIALVPAEWNLQWRIHQLALKERLPLDSMSPGSKLSVTPEGKLVEFVMESEWVLKGKNAKYAKGYVQSAPASKAVKGLHKEMQEHIGWARVVLTESKRLSRYFIVLNALILCFPPVYAYAGVESGAGDILFAIALSTLWLMALGFIRDSLVNGLFSRNQMLIAVTEGQYGNHPHFAFLNGFKSNNIMLFMKAHGLTVKIEGVTLNGSLLFGIYRNENLIEHMVIDARK